MCYHVAISKVAQEVAQRYNAKLEEGKQVGPLFHASGFTFPEWPVITAQEPQKLQFFNWGLIPHWTKTKAEGLKFRTNTLNAQCETVYDKPSFRFSIKEKRCLVPVTGFYEWMDLNKKKYPYYIALKETEIFSLAGIYQDWVDKETGEVFNTFSILTTRANPLMEKIHNMKKRMPVILDPEYEFLWIKPEIEKADFDLLVQPFDENRMSSHTVSRLITSRTDNSNIAEVQEVFIYDELNNPDSLKLF